MASSNTPNQAAIDRSRKERRNLSRRRCYYSPDDRAKSLEQFLVEAKEKSADLIESAEIEARKISRQASEAAQSILMDAKSKATSVADEVFAEASKVAIEACKEALRMRESYEQECSDLKEKSNNLRQSITIDEEKLKMLERQLVNVALREPLRPAELRRRDAARKKEAYWKQKESLRDDLSTWRTQPDEAEDCSGPNRKIRSLRLAVAAAVENIFKSLANFNDRSRVQFFKMFWLHKAVRRFQPSRFGSPKVDASVAAAISDLQHSLHVIKFARRKDYLATKHAVLTCMVGKTTVESHYLSSLAKIFGIKRQNLSKAAVRREAIDKDTSVRYPMGERKTRRDKISDDVRKVVEQYWESNTRISPCTKDKARLRLAKKVYEEHRVHWLEVTEVEFFMSFKEWCEREKNEIVTGLRAFQNLKPYYIRTMKDRMVCCCKQHVEMDMLKDAMNRFSKHYHKKDCTCDCPTCKPLNLGNPHCVASQALITSVRGWIEGALCPIAEGKMWHKKQCLMGLCDKCGVEQLQWCSSDSVGEQLIDWQTFKYLELEERVQQKREKKKGTDECATKKVKRLRMVYEKTTMICFKKHVLVTMKEFIVHNFRARWQSEQFKLCLKTFPRGTVVSSIDFSENYTFKPQNEIQSQHWDNRQVTLLIHVTYRHRQDAVQSMESVVGKSVQMAQDEDNTRDIIADYHFYVSDDNLHDTLFVQHCLDGHNQWMKDQGIQFDQHWVWSDGAASQFKSCRPFYYVARYYRRFGARMKWYFHASGHGKGVADALGGHIKQGIEREQRKGIHGRVLECAHHVVNFCEEKFALGQEKEYGDVQLVRRFFWEIPVGAVNRRKKWDCDPIPGSRSLHCFDGFNARLSTLLQVRELACFCPHCVDDNSSECENVDWTGPFSLHMVKGVLPADVLPDIQSMGCGQGGETWDEGSLAELLQIGDFYAVEAAQPNNWNADFYISQCEEALHTVKEDFEDGYGVAFQAGDLVVKGRWFQPLPGRDSKFVCNDAAPFGYTLAKSVVHIRFGLIPLEQGRKGKGGARTFSLDNATRAAIYDSFT